MSQPRAEINSTHNLHFYQYSGSASQFVIPIVYNKNYDIYFFNLEKCHPFDTKKWGKVAKFLEQYLNENNKNKLKEKTKSDRKSLFVSPLRPISHEELKLVHTKEFIDSIHGSCLTIARATEVAPIVFCPKFIINSKLLVPLKWQTAGSILASYIALKHGWAFNIGGGFHHCSAKSAGGFCLFADITLIIRYLWQEINKSFKILIVDCDAHQGNGYARDVLDMEKDEKKLIYIMDMFNPSIYPGDTYAHSAIDRPIHLRHHTKDKEYLDLLSFHLSATLEEFSPNLIIYNAGTDILIEDPLGNLDITPDGITSRDELVFTVATKNKLPIVMLTSGGYRANNAEVISNSIINLFDKKIISSFD